MRALLVVVLAFLLLAPAALAFTAHADTNWSVQTVDAKAVLGGISIALDSNGNPHLLYSASATGKLLNNDPTYLTYASWNGSEWDTQIVTQAAISNDNSLMMDSNNIPHIAFSQKHNLMYATKNGTTWNIQLVDSVNASNGGGNVGSIALDSFGNPHIAYSGLNHELKYANWDGTRWITQIVDTGQGINSGPTPYLALDSNNHPSIIYGFEPKNQNDTVKYATTDSSLSNWSFQTILSNANLFSLGNLALDSNGYPCFTYYLVASLTYASWNGSAWNMQTVDPLAGNEHSGCSLSINSQNIPSIAYLKDPTSYTIFPVSVMYAKLSDGNWSIQTVDTRDIADTSIQLVLDSSDNPHIAYITLRDDNYYYIDGTTVYATSNQSIPAPTPTATPSNAPTPSPTIPEFPIWMCLSIFAVTALLTAEIIKTSRKGVPRA